MSVPLTQHNVLGQRHVSSFVCYLLLFFFFVFFCLSLLICMPLCQYLLKVPSFNGWILLWQPAIVLLSVSFFMLRYLANKVLSSAIQYLPYGAKKIGPADPEILRLGASKSGTKQNWLPWQSPLRYWKKNSYLSSTPKTLSYGVKIEKNRTWFVFCLQHKISCHGNVCKVIKKKSGSRKFTQISFIWWKDRENRSSRSWDN